MSRAGTVASRKSPTMTFRKKALEQFFVSFCQTSQAVHQGEGTLEDQIRRRLQQEIDFIGNEEFAQSGAEAKFLGEILLGTGCPPAVGKPVRVANLPPHLARLCETRLLSPAEEKAHFQRMNYLRFRAQQYQSRLHPEKSSQYDLMRIEGLLKAADWHRDALLKANMRLVISIVKKFVNSFNSFDDLLSDGAMALLRAIDKFDYDRGFRFSTYATQVVRRNSYRLVMTKQKERQKQAASLEETGLDVEAPDRSSSIDDVRWEQLRSRLSNLLSLLDRREQLIIRARFSLGGHRKVQTLQRLADILGVSKERVRQLEKRALDKLRDLAGSSEDLPLPADDFALAEAS
ncbi:MAG: sigma-70 family RNA polymerase sigma factor [Pirellulaceae bacterium]|jgi:RNA polymerase primary sigma factor